MKVCNRCGIEYTDVTKYCSKCGNCLKNNLNDVEKESIYNISNIKKENANTLIYIKYLIGIIFILGAFHSDDILESIFAFLLGLSLFEITYKLINKIKIFKENAFFKENPSVLKWVIPILILILLIIYNYKILS